MAVVLGELLSAAKFIGRVGGLAVALGVGAAAFSGSAVAWADSPADSASQAQHGSAKATSSTSRVHAASPSAAFRAHTTKVDTPVATVATATGSLKSGPQAPLAPTDSSLDLALLAYARRETAGARATASIPTAPQAVVQAASAATTALVMGPSGVPDPSSTYVTNVNGLYIQPNSPGAVTQVVFTPEGLYPITGVKSLPLNTSVTQGLEMLSQTAGPLLAGGTPVTIFGYSQSAIISSLYQQAEAQLLPTPQNLSFVLVGNEMNPNGGFLSRFPGLKLPSLGLDFYGATPEKDFPTTNYTLEYDGFADFPRYPLNFLSDLNAGLGIVFVHTKYAQLTQTQVDAAIPLQTTDPTQKYYVIPTENLPLLEPLRLIPLIGNPLADLVQPALKVLVNLGYGDPKYGWSNVGDANVETPFGFLPKVNVGEVLQLLVQGVAQGVGDFVTDFSPGGSFWQELHSIKLPSFGPVNLPTSPGGILTAIQNVTTAVAEAISNAAASLYAAALPTADVVNAIVTMLPAYDVTLFIDGIQQAIKGDPIAGLINSIGRPLAADVGLTTTAGLIEVLVLLQAVAGVFGVEVGT
jgi:PE-PPE domain